MFDGTTAACVALLHDARGGSGCRHRYPAVAEAAVIGLPDAEFGDSVRAVVRLHARAQADLAVAEALVAHCRERLAGYKVPKAFVRHDQLPRNAAGKLLRGLLQDDRPPARPPR